MITTTKRRTWLGGLLTLAVGVVLACSADARADRVRVYAATPRVAIDVVGGHGEIAIRSTPRCRIESRQVWHEPVYEWRKVWVDIPAEIERRRVPQYDAHGRRVGYRHIDVVITPARRVRRTERVVVSAGYYETVNERVCGPDTYGFDDAPVATHVVIEKRPKHRRLRRVVRAIRAATHPRVRRHHRRTYVRYHRW